MRTILMAMAAMALLVATINPVRAETPREKCLSNMDSFFKDQALHDPALLKKKNIVGDAHWDSYLLLMKTDMRFLCQKENLDEAIAVAVTQVCPRFEFCPQMKALVDRKLSASQKRCIGDVMDGILGLDDDTRRRAWSAFSISPEGYVALLAVAGKCKE
jgi:hypothetical protein